MNKQIEKVARIIARRDDMLLDEAIELVQEAVDAVRDAVFEGGADAEELWMEMLGLEPDYMLDFIM